MESDKTTSSVYTKFMNEIIKLVSKTQDECVYLLFGGHLSTNNVQTKNVQLTQWILKNNTYRKQIPFISYRLE